MAGNPTKHSDIIEPGNPFDEAIKGMQEMIKLLDKLTKDIKESAKEWQAFTQKQNASTKKGQENLKKAAKATSELTVKEKEALKLRQQLIRQQEKINFLKTEEGQKTLKQVEALKRQERELRNVAKSQDKGAKSTNTWSKALGSFAAKFNTIGNIASNVASKITQTFVKAMKGAINTIVEFDQAMADVKAISQASEKQFEKLSKSAKALGGSTKFTATQVAGLQKEFAKLGFTTDQILELQEATLKLATATDADLGEAALVVGGAMRAYGLEMKDAADVAATLAVATTKSALTFRDYETILSTLGPVARAFGFTLEDTLGLMGQLRNANFDTSKAATATRNILLNLADANGALAKELGGNVTNMEELVSGLIELRERGVDLNTTLELTDKRSVAAFNTFLNGAENAIVLRDAITDVNEELDEMVDIQLNTLENKMTLLKSAWQGYILQLESGTEATSTAKEGIDLMSSSLQLLTKFNAEQTEGNRKFIRVMKDLINPARGWIDLNLLLFKRITKSDEAVEDFIPNVNNLKIAFQGLGNVARNILKPVTDLFKEASPDATKIKISDVIEIDDDDDFDITTMFDKDFQKAAIDNTKWLNNLQMAIRKRFKKDEEQADKEADQRRREKLQKDQEAEDARLTMIQSTINATQQASDAFFSFSQTQSDNKYKAELEAANGNAAEIERIQEEQAKEDQKRAVAQALVNGALGATKTIANLGFPAAIPALIAQAAVLAFQIAAITSVQFEEGGSGMLDDKGHILQGPSHGAGGINPRIEAEGGEYFGIINKHMTRKYQSELPGIFESINNGRFHDVFSRSNIELNKASIFNDPWGKNIYDLLKNQPSAYNDSEGNQVLLFPDGRKRVIKQHGI